VHPQVRRLLQQGRKGAQAVAPIAALATRLAYGKQFMVTGWGKWSNLDNVTQFFTTLGLPMPRANAIVVATIELVGGACLVLGLGTRLCAALLSTTMVVAIFTADRAATVAAFSWSGDLTNSEKVTSFVYLMALLWLVGYGGGPVSVDHSIARNLEKPPS
jgi:putative oxidoreductase